jgi:ribulose 1,5-bisphosphate synthetase/thiazole synthase
MKNISIWNDTVSKKKYNKLVKNITTDVLIVGGGITGTECNPVIKIDNIRAVPNK